MSQQTAGVIMCSGHYQTVKCLIPLIPRNTYVLCWAGHLATLTRDDGYIMILHERGGGSVYEEDRREGGGGRSALTTASIN